MTYDDEAGFGPGVTSPRRRWPLVVALAVLLGAAGAATAYVVASDEDEAPRAVASPSPTPSPTPAPAATPSAASPSAEPSPTASPAPAPTGAPTATRSPTPARAPSSAAPRPTATVSRAFPPKGLRLDVIGEPITGDPPQVRFRIRVRDNDGSEVNGTIDFGDGTSRVYSQRPPPPCRTRPTSPAPGYRAQPIDKTFTVTHAYEASGTFTVVVTANTERFCDGTPAETAQQRLTVVVPERATESPSPAPA